MKEAGSYFTRGYLVVLEQVGADLFCLQTGFGIEGALPAREICLKVRPALTLARVSQNSGPFFRRAAARSMVDLTAS